jgi:hypothetical protein
MGWLYRTGNTGILGVSNLPPRESGIVSGAIRFDPTTHTIGLDRNLSASKVPEQPDPPVPVDGMTFGVALFSLADPACTGVTRRSSSDLFHTQ